MAPQACPERFWGNQRPTRVRRIRQADGTTVRRSALEAAAWGLSEAVTPNALDVAMHRLKRKLTAINSALQIVNARGYGYALRFLPLAT